MILAPDPRSFLGTGEEVGDQPVSTEVLIETDESPVSGDANGPSAATERAEELAVDATVNAAVAASEAENSAEDAEGAAAVSAAAAVASDSAASAAFSAASIAEESAISAGEVLAEVRALAGSIPDIVASTLQALTAPVEEEPTIDEVVTETFKPEVEPRGQHWWFRNRMGGNR